MMKRVASVIAIMAFISLTPARAAQDSIEGYWEGALVRDGAVRVVKIEFIKEGANLRGHLEIPDLVTYGLGIGGIKYEAPKVSFRMSSIGQATLTLDPATGEMTGTAGTNPPVALHLKRAVKPLEAPIKKVEVQFASGNATLAGTLVMPATAGPHPAIVWIHGRGGTLREESARTRLFARHGIASLIYDKRGTGKSTGDFATATINDLASDAQAAARFLASRKDINPKQIGLHGESAGGWIAPLVAVRSEIPVAFVMTSAGPAESLYDQQAHAYEYYMRLSDTKFSEEEMKMAAAHIRLRLRLAFKGEGREEFMASAAKIKGTRMAQFLLNTEEQDARDFDWLRRNDCDPAPDLKKITAPFLAFYGTADYIVPPEENVKKLESYLTAAGNKYFKIVTIQGGDHDLAFPGGARQADGKAAWAWKRVSPQYVETMLNWLLGRVTVARGKE